MFPRVRIEPPFTLGDAVFLAIVFGLILLAGLYGDVIWSGILRCARFAFSFGALVTD